MHSSTLFHERSLIIEMMQGVYAKRSIESAGGEGEMLSGGASEHGSRGGHTGSLQHRPRSIHAHDCSGKGGYESEPVAGPTSDFDHDRGRGPSNKPR